MQEPLRPAHPPMTCPKCGGTMTAQERNGVLIDRCHECRGVFLDRGELERLIDLEQANAPAWGGPAPTAGGHPDPAAGAYPPPAGGYPGPATGGYPAAGGGSYPDPRGVPPFDRYRYDDDRRYRRDDDDDDRYDDDRYRRRKRGGFLGEIFDF